ncbi:MAG: hypothetical protein ACUVV6_01435 [Thermoplasmatota archaeon]
MRQQTGGEGIRKEDVELVEEALGASGAGEDFDEILLRTVKRHLPASYHRRFAGLMEEILQIAGKMGSTNRQAARELVTEARAATPSDAERGAPGEPILQEPLTPAGAGPAAALAEPGSAGSGPVEGGPQAEAGAGSGETGAEGPVKTESEALPAVESILDLGGTAPESLPPEMKDKLRRVVKVQKPKPDWEEGPQEELDPTIWFKGSQRAPAQLPLAPPPKAVIPPPPDSEELQSPSPQFDLRGECREGGGVFEDLRRKSERARPEGERNEGEL